MNLVSIHHLAVADQDLVQQVAEGQLESLGLLFDRHHGSLRRFLSRLQIGSGDLDDLVQLTFLQVPRAAVRFDAGRSVKGWLFGLAMVVVKRHRRSIGRIARKATALAREPSSAAPATPADLVEGEESVRRANRALGALSKKKREVLVMVVLENLSGEVVAEALGVPVGTVWTRLHHARRELRELLKEVEP